MTSLELSRLLDAILNLLDRISAADGYRARDFGLFEKLFEHEPVHKFVVDDKDWMQRLPII